MQSNIVFAERASNIAKTWMLMSAFFVVTIILGFFVSQYFGSPVILFGFIGASLLFNLYSYWFSDRIALSMHGAKEITSATNPDLVAQVKALADKAELPMPRVYLIEESAPNAFATGRNKNHASIAMTTGIVRTLSKEELDGVLAHELAHVGNRDILLSTVVVVLVGAFSILADFISRSIMFGGARSNNQDNQGGGIGLVLVGLLASIVIPFVGLVIQLAISRKREFLADATGALITGTPLALASALQKISSSHRLMSTIHQSTAHLFFASPVSADSKGDSDGSENQEEGRDNGSRSGIFAKIFSTHPPIAERIAKLKAMAG